MANALTSKGQVTVPKAIRDHLRLKGGDRVEFVLRDDGIVEMVPVTSSLKRLRGFLPKPERALTVEEMNEAIAQAASGDIDWD